MNLKTLKDTPAWEWPRDAARKLLGILSDDRAEEPDRLLAAEMAGDFTVINEELVEALLSILQNAAASEQLRCKAALSLGPVLEHSDTHGFDEVSDAPISERTFGQIQTSLQTLYMDADVPEGVRRRILEASVRAPQDWHQGAIRAAYSSGDEDWKLTAVFAMRWIRGFDEQILEALNSKNEDIHYQAVCAAGTWERVRLLSSGSTRRRDHEWNNSADLHRKVAPRYDQRNARDSRSGSARGHLGVTPTRPKDGATSSTWLPAAPFRSDGAAPLGNSTQRGHTWRAF